MAIVTVEIDLAKYVFAVRGVDESGKPALVHPEVNVRLGEITATPRFNANDRSHGVAGTDRDPKRP